ncbi:MAG: endopeptidase La [Clostridia bacterium]
MEDKLLPVIALRGVVVFPDCTATIDIGRELTYNAVDTAYNGGGMVLCLTQKDISVVEPSANDIYNIGTVAKVRQVLKLPGNNVRVLISGVYRGLATDINMDGSYIVAETTPIIEINNDTVKAEALLRKCREALAELAVNSKKISKELLLELTNTFEYNKFVNILANVLVYQDERKQQFLEMADTEMRLEEIIKVVSTEIEISKMDKRIAGRVKKQIDQGQREYYLKEQIKAIGAELGDDDEQGELEKKIKSAGMPADIEQKALKELNRMAKMSPSSPDASVIRGYIEWLTDLKWNTQTIDNKDLKRAKEILDEDHFGLEKIKERILEYLAVMQLTGSMKGPILCFVGPPGVGKTSIVKSIARALDRKYVRISLGGVRDEAEIRGHRRTYIGAIPGKIIYMLKQAQCINPVFLFDEIDKMSSDLRGDPASAMLEVLDPEQNFAFVDHYMEVPFDLSKILFVATANTVESVPPALLDRMEIIELTGYTEEEKICIADKFLLPKIKKSHGIENSNFKLNDETIREIVSKYTRESGVRTLEREIATIARKVALKLVNEESNIDVNPSNLSEYLGIERYREDILDMRDEIGSATGLAWTAVGGVTLTIDVTLFKGKGEILLTGKLGDVMKESARTSISLVRSMATEYSIDPNVFAETDIHIHIPEGAIPKDGPSAGVTMSTALMSAFSHMPVSKKVAMTGEVTLRGKVLAIGGLKEKALAAYRAGIRKIIVPKDNELSVTEIPEEVKKQIEFIYADDIKTVFNAALVKI